MAKPTISGLVAKAKADLAKTETAAPVQAEDVGTARATYTLPADLVELVDRLGAYRRLSIKRERAKGAKTEDPRQSASAVIAAVLRAAEPELRAQLDALRREDPL